MDALDYDRHTITGGEHMEKRLPQINPAREHTEPFVSSSSY